MPPDGRRKIIFIIHLAIYKQAEIAVLERKSKREDLNITPEIWGRDDDDEINAVIQQRYHDMPLAQVMQTFRQNHEHLLEKLSSMTEADLLLPIAIINRCPAMNVRFWSGCPGMPFIITATICPGSQRLSGSSKQHKSPFSLSEAIT